MIISKLLNSPHYDIKEKSLVEACRVEACMADVPCVCWEVY